MSISQYERYHGSVLTQIFRKPDMCLKLAERNKRHDWCRYDIEDNKYPYSIFVKLTKNVRTGKRKHAGQFPADLDRY